MSREDYVAIVARLFAIYIAITIVLDIPAAVFTVPRFDEWPILPLAVSAFVTLAALVSCFCLWVFPLAVARKFLPVMKEPRSERSIDGPVGLSLGITLIGLWFLIQALLDSVYWLIFVARMKGNISNPMVFEWNNSDVSGMVVTGVQLVVGVLLIVGTPGLKRLFYFVRYGKQ